MKTKKTNSKEYFLAVEYFKKNEFKKTIEICKKIINFKRHNEEVYYLLALALAQLKNYNDAVLEIEEAIKINKNKIEFFIFKGNLNREIKNYEKALQSFQVALEINSENTEALYWISVTMYQMGQKKSALNIVNNAIKIESNTKLKLFKAKCLEDLYEFNEALIEYNTLLDNNEREFKALLGKSDLLRRMFKYDLAIEYATKAMDIDKTNINCYLLKSVIYKDMQKIEESLKILDEGLIIKPKSEQANFNKSIILLQEVFLCKVY